MAYAGIKRGNGCVSILFMGGVYTFSLFSNALVNFWKERKKKQKQFISWSILEFSSLADAGAAMDQDTQHPRCQTSPDWKLPGTSACVCVCVQEWLWKHLLRKIDGDWNATGRRNHKIIMSEKCQKEKGHTAAGIPDGCPFTGLWALKQIFKNSFRAYFGSFETQTLRYSRRWLPVS